MDRRGLSAGGMTHVSIGCDVLLELGWHTGGGGSVTRAVTIQVCTVTLTINSRHPYHPARPCWRSSPTIPGPTHRVGPTYLSPAPEVPCFLQTPSQRLNRPRVSLSPAPLRALAPTPGVSFPGGRRRLVAAARH